MRSFEFLDPTALSKLGNLELRARTIVEGALAGLHRSPHHGSSVEFAEHKEYSPGDEIKFIDWKAYGKFDKYYIKRFEEETELSAYFLIDSSASMGYAGKAASKLDCARTITAALAYFLLKQQDQVGLVVFDEKLRAYLPPRARGGQLHELLRKLETLQAIGRSDLERALTYVSEVAKRRSLIVVLSDLFGSEQADEKEWQGLRHLLLSLRAMKHDVAVFQILDDDELTLPFSGTSLFEAMEEGSELLVDPDETRRAYRREIDRFVASYQQRFAEGDVEYHLVRSSDSPIDVVRDFLSGPLRRIR